MAEFKTLKQFLEMDSDVVPAQAHVHEDVAQDVARIVFQAAEQRIANRAAEEGGHGFSGDAIAAEAEKIFHTAKTLLDDLIKQG